MTYNLRDPDGIVHIAYAWWVNTIESGIASLRCYAASGLNRVEFAEKGYMPVPDGTAATCITCIVVDAES